MKILIIGAGIIAIPGHHYTIDEILGDLAPLTSARPGPRASLWPSLSEAGGFEESFRDRKIFEKGLASLHECLGLLERRGARLEGYPLLFFYRSKFYDMLETAEVMGYAMPVLSSYRPVIDAFSNLVGDSST
jgi:hypothetical protein